MAKDSNIPWTHHTFNIVWGCTKVSPGCKNCYAKDLSEFYGYSKTGKHQKSLWEPSGPRRTFGPSYWRQLHDWNLAAMDAGERHRVFACSMCDLFERHKIVDAERAKFWPAVHDTPYLDYLCLTKRHGRILDQLPAFYDLDRGGWPNIWLGVSVENDDWRERADELRDIPAVVRFLSCEPALGSYDRMDLKGFDWVICGAESGPNRRPYDLNWARALRDRCRALGIAFYYKQGSHHRPDQDFELDGEVIREFPTPRRIAA